MSPARPNRLPGRQARALALAADGFVNAEIAELMTIRATSVHRLLYLAALRLGGHSRLTTLLLAHHAGLVDLSASAARYAERLAA